MKHPWTVGLLHGLTIVATGWFLALCVAHSQAGVSILWLVATIYGGAAILVSWLVLLATSKAARRVRLSLKLAPAGAMIFSAMLLYSGEPPNPFFRARFELSRSRFTAAAEQCRKQSTCHPSRVGLFPVERSYVLPNQIWFITASCHFIDSCGVVYSPAATPPESSDNRYTSLGGGWYHVYEGF